MATIIPISTNTTIAACTQIQVGDMTSARVLAGTLDTGGDYLVGA